MDELLKYKNKCKKYKKQIRSQKIIIEGLTMLVKKYEIKMEKEKDEMIAYLKTKQIKDKTPLDIPRNESNKSAISKPDTNENIATNETALESISHANKLIASNQSDQAVERTAANENKNTIVDRQINEQNFESKKELANTVNNAVQKNTRSCAEQNLNEDNADIKKIIEDNINELLQKPQKTESEFVVKFTFRQFLDYCVNSKLRARDVKNVSIYVKNNKKGILKLLFNEINQVKSYDALQIFWFLGHYLSVDEKLIVCHDLFLFVSHPYKIVPFVYALYRNGPRFIDIFGNTLKILLTHQLKIDQSVCTDTKVLEFYKEIFDSLKLTHSYTNILEHASSHLQQHDIVVDGKLNPILLNRALSIKLILSFLDWEIARKFLIDKLVPALSTHPSYIFYFGVVLSNFLRQTAKHETVLSFYGYLENFLDADSVVDGAMAYMFLKQLKLGKYDYWYEAKKDHINKLGLENIVLAIF